MANIQFSFFLLLLTFFLQLLHARESQFFSKFTKESQLMPTTTNQQQQQQQQQQPDFIPQNKDSIGYGLYPSSTTTNGGGATDNLPVSSFPENYNAVAFETTDSSPNNYNGDDSTMYNNQKQERFYRRLPTGTSSGTDVTFPKNYNPVAYTTPIHGMDSYQEVGMSGTRFMDGHENMYNSEKQGVRDMYNSGKQGMSDTKFMENGYYYHDLNGERFDANMDANPRGNGYNTRGYFGNNDNSYNTRYNSNARFQEKQEYVFNP